MINKFSLGLPEGSDSSSRSRHMETGFLRFFPEAIARSLAHAALSGSHRSFWLEARDKTSQGTDDAIRVNVDLVPGNQEIHPTTEELDQDTVRDTQFAGLADWWSYINKTTF